MRAIEIASATATPAPPAVVPVTSSGTQKSPAITPAPSAKTRSSTSLFVSRVENFRGRLDDLKELFPDQVHIRTYCNLPCAPIYAIERDQHFFHGYSGYFLQGETQFRMPHFEWHCEQAAEPLFFGTRLLSYVKHKWETPGSPIVAGRSPTASSPNGYWIYWLELDNADKSPGPSYSDIYGQFFVYDAPNRKQRAEGEAFYVGRPPTRRERRGLWKSTALTFTHGNDSQGMTIAYDMSIQTTISATEERFYRGQFDLEKTNGSDVYLGKVRSVGGHHLSARAFAVRLTSPDDIVCDRDGFQHNLRAIFERHLRKVPYEIS